MEVSYLQQFYDHSKKKKMDILIIKDSIAMHVNFIKLPILTLLKNYFLFCLRVYLIVLRSIFSSH